MIGSFFLVVALSSLGSTEAVCWNRTKPECIQSRFCIWCQEPFDKTTKVTQGAMCMPGGQYGANDNSKDPVEDKRNLTCKYSKSQWIVGGLTLPFFLLISLLAFLGSFAILEVLVLCICSRLKKRSK
ncbi:hypothetical protein BLNAU_8370 [Blattamonas nauphoetae]|uniref:Uncharacterized protein n=1 Tax=Blattamonas nauphoetae TaxID=2049346 RepID=A0ABQ9XZ38_9EUKA|nr:hypothetical protein BLNAU_8370 [Blattamonas nauphoetae]